MSGLRVFVFYCLEATYTNFCKPDECATTFCVLHVSVKRKCSVIIFCVKFWEVCIEIKVDYQFC